MSDPQKYAAAAVRNACNIIGSAPAGQRNVVLNAEAFGLGQLVGSGLLSLAEARAALLDAACQAGLDRHEAAATVKSGLEGGMKNPRESPDAGGRRVTPPDGKATPSEERLSVAEYARRLYREAAGIDGTLAEKYLREHRDIPGSMPQSFRFHPSVWHKESQANLPALIAPIIRTASPEQISAVHCTFLNPRDGRKISVPPAKKMFGSCKGGAIWLAPFATQMLCAEGIEKGLACQAATGIPTAVGLSATILPSIIWPRGTQSVTLCADPNGAGEAAIHRAAALYAADNVQLTICYPPKPELDWDQTPSKSIQAAVQAAKLWTRPEKTAEPKKKTALPSTDVSGMEQAANGALLRNEHNVRLAIETIGVTLSYNEFAGEYRIDGVDGYGPECNKDALEELYLTLQREFLLKPAWNDFAMIVKASARRNKFHPVQKYLASLAWDQTPRIDNWLSVYGGAEDTPLVRAVGRIVLIAAVRRIRSPGCKFDEMLVLESPEGRLKSTAFSILASEAWFTDSAPFNAEPREVIERLRGRWIVECADLSGMSKPDVEHLKAFLSRKEDISTLKYDAETTALKRSCIFVGTTNKTAYLISDTGNRRFWPVKIDTFDTGALARDRDQIWAEAALCETSGESIRLDPALWPAAAREQEARRIVDPWRDTLESTIGHLAGKILLDDVWRIIGKPKGLRHQYDNVRLGAVMRDIGWERRQIKLKNQKIWGYTKGALPYKLVDIFAEGDGFTARVREAWERDDDG